MASERGNLRRLLGEVVPGRPAVLYPDGRVVTYGELADAADRIAEKTPPDDGASIGLCVFDPVPVVAWTVGLLSRGTSVFLSQPELPAAELRAIADHEGATALVIDATRIPQRFTDLSADVAVAGEILAWRGTATQRRRWNTGAALHFYTSSTSGKRKGAVRPESTLLLEGEAIAKTLGYSDASHVLCTVPLCHAYGFALGVLGVLTAGATLAFARPMTRGQLAKVVHLSRSDVLVGAPALYDVWSRGVAAHTEHRLRLCVSAGAPLAPDMASLFKERWGIKVSQQYGTTECGAISVDLAEGGVASRVGRPYPGVRVTINAFGEIIVASSYAATGYVGDVHKTMPRNPFTASGVLTGDLGRIDEHGRLHITGRCEEVITVHGEKVDPTESNRSCGHMVRSVTRP